MPKRHISCRSARMRAEFTSPDPQYGNASGLAILGTGGSMDKNDLIARWVRHWQEAGPELEAIRRAEVRDADNLHVLALLETAFNQALRSRPIRMTSGLVEMQALFAKLRT